MNCSVSKATPSRRSEKIIVLGGGIAGLSVYASLTALNFDVQIFERSSPSVSSGMGFLLLQNGVDTLNKIGLGSAFSTISKSLDNYKSFEKANLRTTREPLDGVYAVKRDDIMSMLFNRINPSDIHYNKSFDHFLYDDIGMAKIAVMEDGTHVEGDIFIAADGINSKIRSFLFPEYQLEETDDHEIVCLLPSVLADLPVGDDLVKFLNSADGVNMGMFKLHSNELLWYLQFDRSKHGSICNTKTGMESFLDYIANYLPVHFQKVLSLSDPANCFYWKTKRMDLLPSFHQANILLIGDAAHPLLTFTSQGVNSALQDALVLADLLKDAPNSLDEILTAFYCNRKDEISRYIKEGDELLEQFSSAKLQGLPLVC
jgi:2-polyprenyl-6-methoxyphenol hydroxylase-like FAD-dependent oxidoreductase